MVFGKKKNHHDQYDERYARRPMREKREQPALGIHLVILAVFAIVALGLIWAMSGRTMVEKTLKELITPVGLIWVLLWLGVWFSFVHKRAGAAIVFLFVWCLLTAGGNQILAKNLMHSLEQPWMTAPGDAPTIPDGKNNAPPFDLLILLGGGTSVDPMMHPQLAGAGDRLMTVARIFHTGKVNRICVTGEQSFRADPDDPDPAEEARDLLQQIGVSADSIVALRGHNTSEEIQCVREWMAKFPDSETWRVGLVTSAWHMSRAMGLAEKAGLKKIQAVPSDWVSSAWTPSPNMVIPSGGNLDITAKAIHEYLGQKIGR
jgi:uncharacterized SAM-binding protein YcdF (DUF218 family)